ncbi:MAG: hypothetical protein R2873_26400 [Caldilineaceae bacterium]
MPISTRRLDIRRRNLIVGDNLAYGGQRHNGQQRTHAELATVQQQHDPAALAAIARFTWISRGFDRGCLGETGGRSLRKKYAR